MSPRTKKKSSPKRSAKRTRSNPNTETATGLAVKKSPKRKASRTTAKKKSKDAGGVRANAKSRASSGAKSKTKFTFHQRLGRLTVSQASKLLGDDGANLMQQGHGAFEIDFDRDVYLGRDVF